MKQVISYVNRTRGLPLFDNKKSFLGSLLASSAAAQGVNFLSQNIGSLFENDPSEVIAWFTNEANKEMQNEANRVNLQIADSYNKNQLALQDKMNQFNLDMWNLNNEYNSPSSQVQRAMKAGINPNMVFGQPVASQPVQQSSLPDQQMPSVQAAKISPWTPSMLGQKRLDKTIQMFSNFANELVQLPFNKERMQALKLENQSRAIDNEIKELELDAKKDENTLYSNNGYYVSVDGKDVISPFDFETLTPADQQKYMIPQKYRNTISDKLIDRSAYLGLKDDQKRLFEPDYDGATPNLVKLPFRTKAGFETFKAVNALGNTLTDIRADRLQSKLRELVSSGQLADNEVTNALIKVPQATFDNVVASYKRTIADLDYKLKVNQNLADRLKNQDDILRYTAMSMEKNMDKDTLSIIRKYLPEGGIRDFATVLYSMLSGAADKFKFAPIQLGHSK